MSAEGPQAELWVLVRVFVPPILSSSRREQEARLKWSPWEGYRVHEVVKTCRDCAIAEYISVGNLSVLGCLGIFGMESCSSVNRGLVMWSSRLYLPSATKLYSGNPWKIRGWVSDSFMTASRLRIMDFGVGFYLIRRVAYTGWHFNLQKVPRVYFRSNLGLPCWEKLLQKLLLLLVVSCRSPWFSTKAWVWLLSGKLRRDVLHIFCDFVHKNCVNYKPS